MNHLVKFLKYFVRLVGEILIGLIAFAIASLLLPLAMKVLESIRLALMSLWKKLIERIKKSQSRKGLSFFVIRRIYKGYNEKLEQYFIRNSKDECRSSHIFFSKGGWTWFIYCQPQLEFFFQACRVIKDPASYGDFLPLWCYRSQDYY